MKTFISTARKLMLYIFAVVLVGGSPMVAFADASGAAPSEEDGGYVYDESTGRWNSNKWLYDPATNTYIPNPSYAPKSEPTAVDDASSIDNTAPDSNNEIETDSTGSIKSDVANQNAINNKVSGVAGTGAAAVSSNNTAGSAKSGDATTVATLMNAINSSTALGGGKPYTFTRDIYGDVYGDIELAPELLKAMADKNEQAKDSETLNYKVLDKNTINNDIDLGANSGDAAVLDNTKAGSATSGNATAIANVLNIINSVITAKGSFVGTINIHGNLNGDILMSREGSPSLIASNAKSNPLTEGSLIANQNNLTDIINNIDLDATTGKANVDNNNSAGSAKSGKADTNLVVMNLSGHNVVAKNSLLVFVNVLGKWVGIIVDAPTGATAAVLGDDVTSNIVAHAAERDTTIDSDTQNKIVNNIRVGAHTGDATVSGNTNAGDAVTGDASASAVVFNMVNSAFSVSDWFGVLFINVLGSWYGSFGVDTPQGDEVTASLSPASEQTGAEPVAAQVFRFIEHNLPSGGSNAANPTATSAGALAVASRGGVLAASNHSSIAPTSTDHSENPATISPPLAIAILTGLAAGVFAVMRLIGAVRGRYTAP